MLIQTLVMIAIMTIMSATLLTNSLISAEVSRQQRERRELTIALQRGTDDFIRWSQHFVAQNSAKSDAWPRTPQSDSSRPFCESKAAMSCLQTELTTFRVTGASIIDQVGGRDIATNLQSAINENRVSGIVTVTVVGPLGTIEFVRTRQITMRIFDAQPYVVVTGMHDLTTISGDVASTEGDTGGYSDSAIGFGYVAPDPRHPSLYRDTLIKYALICENDKMNSYESDAFKDNHTAQYGNLPWGVAAQGFEAPCAPTYTFVAGKGPPIDAQTAVGNAYELTSRLVSKHWSSTQNFGGWAH